MELTWSEQEEIRDSLVPQAARHAIERAKAEAAAKKLNDDTRPGPLDGIDPFTQQQTNKHIEQQFLENWMAQDRDGNFYKRPGLQQSMKDLYGEEVEPHTLPKSQQDSIVNEVVNRGTPLQIEWSNCWNALLDPHINSKRKFLIESVM